VAECREPTSRRSGGSSSPSAELGLFCRTLGKEKIEISQLFDRVQADDNLGWFK